MEKIVNRGEIVAEHNGYSITRISNKYYVVTPNGEVTKKCDSLFLAERRLEEAVLSSLPVDDTLLAIVEEGLAQMASGRSPDDAICPACGGIVQFSRSGKWTVTLTAKCVGQKVGWMQYENPCPFRVEGSDSSAFNAWNRARQAPESHRDGRTGMKELLQMNEDGYDPRFD